MTTTPPDMITLTAATMPPAADAVREAHEYVLAVILEDLDSCVRAKIAEFWSAVEISPRSVIELAAQYRRERADALRLARRGQPDGADRRPRAAPPGITATPEAPGT